MGGWLVRHRYSKTLLHRQMHSVTRRHTEYFFSAIHEKLFKCSYQGTFLFEQTDKILKTHFMSNTHFRHVLKIAKRDY
jgi:hypothetical protein